MKSEVNAVYGDVYSTVEVFLISRNGSLIGAFKSFSEWFECSIVNFEHVIAGWGSLTPAGNYMFQVNNRSIRTRSEICSKLTIMIPRQWRRSGNFIVNFEHISHLVLLFLLLTLNM